MYTWQHGNGYKALRFLLLLLLLFSDDLMIYVSLLRQQMGRVMYGGLTVAACFLFWLLVFPLHLTFSDKCTHHYPYCCVIIK